MGDCVVCWDKPGSSRCRECHHSYVCPECYTQLIETTFECPLCRTPLEDDIQYRLKILLGFYQSLYDDYRTRFASRFWDPLSSALNAMKEFKNEKITPDKTVFQVLRESAVILSHSSTRRGMIIRGLGGIWITADTLPTGGKETFEGLTFDRKSKLLAFMKANNGMMATITFGGRADGKRYTND